MKVQLVSSPNAIQHAPDNSAQLRAKAVEAFNKASQPGPNSMPQNESPVQNQNAVSAEELGAIKASTGQPRNTEASQEVTEVDVASLPAVPEPTAPPKEDPALSRQFAQLARQEKALRAKVQQQEQSMRAREEAIKAKEAELAAKAPDLTQYIPKDRIKKDILSVMAEEGLSYDELTQQILNQRPPDPRTEATINRLEAKIQQLERHNEESRKSQAEQQTQAYQAAVKQIRIDVNNLVSNDPNFETIKATRSAKDVVDLITQTYDKDGVLLSVEDAAQQVEDYLTEEAMKLTRIGKIKNKLGLNASSPKPGTQQQPPAKPVQTQPMKTLTNATSSTRQLSAKERAILAFKGELKS